MAKSTRNIITGFIYDPESRSRHSVSQSEDGIGYSQVMDFGPESDSEMTNIYNQAKAQELEKQKQEKQKARNQIKPKQNEVKQKVPEKKVLEQKVPEQKVSEQKTAKQKAVDESKPKFQLVKKLLDKEGQEAKKGEEDISDVLDQLLEQKLTMQEYDQYSEKLLSYYGKVMPQHVDTVVELLLKHPVVTKADVEQLLNKVLFDEYDREIQVKKKLEIFKIYASHYTVQDLNLLYAYLQKKFIDKYESKPLEACWGGKEHIHYWKEQLKILRERSLHILIDKINQHLPNAKLPQDELVSVRALSLFNKHRNKEVWKGGFGRTGALQQFDRWLSELKGKPEATLFYPPEFQKAKEKEMELKVRQSKPR